MERERNYLPLTIATSRFNIILQLLEKRPTDSAQQARLFEEVFDRFRTWVVSLLMPYFYENGWKHTLNATEEEMHLKNRLRKFLCYRRWSGDVLNHAYCEVQGALIVRPTVSPKRSKESLSDEDYCDEMLPKIVHQSDVTVDVALGVLERCQDQVLASPNKEDFMSKLTSKVETKKEMERLKEWEKKHRSLKTQNAFKWAEHSIEKAEVRVEAVEKCRDMVFQTLRKVFA